MINQLLKIEQKILMTVTWISSLLFGVYILAFYIGAFFADDLSSWNNVLPGLYVSSQKSATAGIGIHFAAGGLILALGSIQFLDWIRKKYLNFHRIIGRIYIIASLLAALGGLLFIGINGTIGGTVMDLGFGLYGTLLFIAAIQTVRNARLGNLREHEKWAMRLYALAIASWLYRMEYGLWFSVADRAGHNDQFTGLFDQVMSFFFYLPNLVLVEFLLIKRTADRSTIKNIGVITALGVSIFIVILGTYYFFKYYWGPAILKLFL